MIARRHFARLFAGLALGPTIVVHAGSPRRVIAPIHPIHESDDPFARQFLTAAAHGQTVSFYYIGGANPGILRRFRPRSLYRLEPGGPIYATGECHLRRATRVFRLDRVRLA